MKIEGRFIKDGRERLIVINLDEEAAVAIMHSIAGQVHTRSPNLERQEYRTIKGEYFSIVVDEFRPRAEDVHIMAKQMFDKWTDPYIKEMERYVESPKNKKSKKGGKKNAGSQAQG